MKGSNGKWTKSIFEGWTYNGKVVKVHNIKSFLDLVHFFIAVFM